TTEPGTRPRRYRMLETLKEFGRRKAAPTVLTTAQAAHRAWVLRRAEATEQMLYGKDARSAMERTTRDLPEIRAAFASALQSGEGVYALRLGGALQRYWHRWGHIAEGLGWLRAALDTCQDAAPGPRARALVGVSGLSYLMGDFATAAQSGAEAARHAREAGDVATESTALAYHALFEGLGGAAGSAALAEASVELARTSGQQRLEAENLMMFGMVLQAAGQSDRARDVLARCADVSRESGHRYVQAYCCWLPVKGDIADRPAEALAAGLAALRILEEDGDVTSWLTIAHGTAAALTLTGRAEAGAVLLGFVDEQGSRIGYSPGGLDPVDGPTQAGLVREALPAEDFDRCHERGRAMSFAEAAEELSAFKPGH
ncbi:hypothetical protein ACFYUS_39015, partial [Streptomyces sp. NPDC004284]